MTEDIDRLFQKTKGQLFMHRDGDGQSRGAGFLGRILAQVEFSWSTEVATAAISPKRLWWNPGFFLGLTGPRRVTVLAHELWHNALMHTIRLGNRCPEKWNEAADHVINLLLEEHGYDMSGFPYLMDPKYRGWSTEEVYDDLARQGGASLPNPMGNDIIQGDPDDTHDAVAKVVAAMSAARISGEAGDIPGEVPLVIDRFLNPKLPWETLLFRFFNEMTSEAYSYARPSRRHEDPLLPGKNGRNGLEHLVYYLDISGSISDEHILRFNSEVKFIKEELQPELLTLVTFDTRIRDEWVFERDDPFEKIVVTGRGGTALGPVMTHMKRHAPTAAVIFTDLEVQVPENPGIPVIWACIDNPSMTVPYGRLVHIRD